MQDAKGFYYCFGCQAKGDAIGFIKETENVGFMEAVEILAAEAGMNVPKPDPKMAEKADRRKELADVMDEAVRWFQVALKTGAAVDARAYLDRRGLNSEALQQFEIGFAPNDRAGLKSALMGRGISEQHLVDTGLISNPMMEGPVMIGSVVELCFPFAMHADAAWPLAVARWIQMRGQNT